MSVKVNNAVITDQAASVLAELQNDNNDFIEMYSGHLDKISDMLFLMGNDVDISKPKNEVFELLNNTHLLRKDLNALRAPINENKLRP